MTRRIAYLPAILLIAAICLPSGSRAQVSTQVIANARKAQAQGAAKVSLAPAVGSVIVKLRALPAPGDTLVINALRSIASSADVLRPVFRHPGKGSNALSVGGYGLDRIYQVPLREGLSAGDAVSAVRAALGKQIEYVEPNYRYQVDLASTPNDSLYYAQWFLPNIHAPEAWQTTEGDSTVRVGFVDTGVDFLHPDLRFQFAVNPLEDINHNGLFDPWSSDSIGMDAHGNMVHGDIDGIDHDGNGYANDVIGYDFVDQESLNIGDWTGRDPVPQDENGHGTMVAGVIAAEQNNHIGTSGVAPKCRLVALRAFDATGVGEDDDIASAIVYAADAHIPILNLSFGDIIPSLLQRDAIRYATAMGTLVVASSGNGGGDAPHYPSDFDEVLSVGATTNYPSPDNLFAFTQHSEGMDLVAPGDDIITTHLGGTYTQTQGTSFSSPVAAGVAALVLSAHRAYTGVELRSVLESTAQDILSPGYDHQSANGRVDAGRALAYVGASAIKITSPHTLDEHTSGDTIRVTGSAVSPLFTGYTLDYAAGFRPDTNPLVNNWVNIAHGTSQVMNGNLGAWVTRGLAPGYYTLRLAVTSTDGRSTEEHLMLFLTGDAPQFVSLECDTIFVRDRRGIMIIATSDEPARFAVEARSISGATVTRSDDRMGIEHAVIFTGDDLAPGERLTLTATFTDANGGVSVDQLFAGIPTEAISQSGFSMKSYALPAGYALDTVLTTTTGDQVIESVFPDGLNFGPLGVFQFNRVSKRFREVDSLPDTWIPRALGNTRGGGAPELLLQVGAHTRLYRQNASHSILGDVLSDQTLWGSTLADLTHAGMQQIIGYGGIYDDTFAVQYDQYGHGYLVPDSIYYAFAWNGTNYGMIGRMPNRSKIDLHNNPSNSYSEPNAAHADLDGSGLESLVTIDNDADLVIYQYAPTEPTKFKTVYMEQNSGQAEGSLVAVGDLDGDGRPDIAYAYHSVFSSDSLGEYPPGYPQNYWTVKVLRNLGGMKFETILSEHVLYAKPLTPYRSSVQCIRSVTGHGKDDLVLSFFPNFYLLEYDSAARKMKPIWYFPVSASPRGALAYDFDRNGRREFGFVVGDSIRFFEQDSALAFATPSPGGLVASPRDTDRVDLMWGAVSRAQGYNVYRGTLSTEPTLLAVVTGTTYTDTLVAVGDTLVYYVTAVDAAHSPAESESSLPAFAVVHAMPRLESVVRSTTTSLVLHTSQPIRTAQLSGGVLLIDGSITPSSCVVAGDSMIAATFDPALSIGKHRVQVSGFSLRDVWNAPFDTAQRLEWSVEEQSQPERFYIVSWTFDYTRVPVQVQVIFNQPGGLSVFNTTHYALSPYGSFARVRSDSVNDNAVYIELAPEMKIVALGAPFVLCAHGIASRTGIPIDSTDGNCVGVSLTEPSLDNVETFPNPVKLSNGKVTFSRLTASAHVSIYTLGMRFIRTIATTEEQGGVDWDLRDSNGNIVPSGMYLYFVSGTDATGSPVTSRAAKLVVIDDTK